MPTRDKAPAGAPCWADLWTSDVEGSRAFYKAVFGWESGEPDPDFGGYFIFTRDGVEIAGGMGDMGDVRANDTWKVYLSTDDISKSVDVARSEGAEILAPPMPVADLGVQTVLVDPTGAHLGAWEPKEFPGFTVLNENAAPSWFELQTRDHGRAVAFYSAVFDWETEVVDDTDEFRYTIVRDPSREGEIAGIMDATSFLAPEQASRWSIYWEVDDVDATIAKVTELGGGVLQGAQSTPYGRVATVTDPAGAEFKLRTSPR